MTLNFLLKKASGLQNDSRKVKPGDVFLAYPGHASDGRLYAHQAIQNGAVGIIYDPNGTTFDFKASCSVPCEPMPHLAQHLLALARDFYPIPKNEMQVVGVTGTNGKTSIAYQLAQAHDWLGKKSAYIGTLGEGVVGQLNPGINTTPDVLALQQLFYGYHQQGLHHVSMEVSSHALDQGRVAGIDFTQAIFTNLTHDHLDYHHTIEAYAAAKAKLFSCASLQWAFINGDSPWGASMVQNNPRVGQTLFFGLEKGRDVRAIHVETNSLGSQFDVASPWGLHQVRIQQIGLFNIYNALAVFASLMAEDYAGDAVVEIMSQLRAAPGRLEKVSDTPCVMVDYAHTPDALKHVLETLSKLKQGKLWVVFGCGGNRDVTKRPIMGQIASLYADHIVLTNDNPRHEDPDAILKAIEEGMTPGADCVRIPDRHAAIEYALKHSGPHDMVLIAGKGHEAYQQMGDVCYDFSDQAVVAKILAKN